jgi:hypothetical protein
VAASPLYPQDVRGGEQWVRGAVGDVAETRPARRPAIAPPRPHPLGPSDHDVEQINCAAARLDTAC